MNKFVIVFSALFACLLFVSAALAKDEVENEVPEGSDESELDGGFHRNPVGKTTDDIWGLDVNEKGLPKAVEEKKKLCSGLYFSEKKCKVCCQAKGQVSSFSRLGCTCHQTNNHYMQ